MAVSGVARPQGGRPVDVFYPFEHPTLYPYGNHHPPTHIKNKTQSSRKREKVWTFEQASEKWGKDYDNIRNQKMVCFFCP
jgi:hypothetical protein